MALLKSIILAKYSIPIIGNCYRNIQTTSIRVIDMKWREDRRLHRNPNAHGPLTDFPDYTFMDGDRCTPLGVSRLIFERMPTFYFQNFVIGEFF